MEVILQVGASTKVLVDETENKQFYGPMGGG